jgi:hypothetical protein
MLAAHVSVKHNGVIEKAAIKAAFF